MIIGKYWGISSRFLYLNTINKHFLLLHTGHYSLFTIHFPSSIFRHPSSIIHHPSFNIDYSPLPTLSFYLLSFIFFLLPFLPPFFDDPSTKTSFCRSVLEQPSNKGRRMTEAISQNRSNAVKSGQFWRLFGRGCFFVLHSLQ